MRAPSVSACLLILGCADRERHTSGDVNPNQLPPFTTAVDATPRSDALQSQTIRGAVCEVKDLREPNDCSVLKGQDLRVELVDQSTSVTVAGDGSFSLEPGTDAEVVLRSRSAGDLWMDGATTAQAGSAVELRLISRDYAQTLFAVNQVAQPPGLGMLVVQVLRSGAPAMGATLGDVDVSLPFYDAGDPWVFDPNGSTGASGTAVYFGLGPGPLMVPVTLSGVRKSLMTQVVADAVMFAAVAF